MAATDRSADAPVALTSATFTVTPWTGITGPQLDIAAFAPGRIPVWLITYIVANYGQAGGAVSIF